MILIRTALGSVACLGVFVSVVLLIMVPFLSPSRVAAVSFLVLTIFFLLFAVASILRLASRSAWILAAGASLGPIVTFAMLPLPGEADRIPFLFVTGFYSLLWWAGMLIDRSVNPQISTAEEFTDPDE